MGWERRGELPTFPFAQQKADGSNPSSRGNAAHLITLASECNDLLATVQGVKRALHSTRRQIKISNSVLPSIINQADVSSLVRDLFPGPAGDAPVQDPNKSPDFPPVAKPESSGLQSSIKDAESREESLSQSSEDSLHPKIKTTSSNVPDKQNSEVCSKTSEASERNLFTSSESVNAEGRNTVTDRELNSSSGSSELKAPEDGKAESPHQNEANETPVQRNDVDAGGNHGVLQRAVSRSPSSPSSCNYPSNNLWDTGVKQQNGGLSPNHVSSLYLGVNGRAERGTSFFNEEDEDTQDNDTDTAEESADPYKNCEHNLLVHVQKVHTDIEQQLEGLEARILGEETVGSCVCGRGGVCCKIGIELPLSTNFNILVPQ
ncbi:hypothetical protein ElyMa_005445800 [Elysia marginata]|uniref:Uncharacterized protein n=1 Tax=Elysia marginata TaxID=1093978 RepID=A0AAV4EM33_9GAST|nr:hypothetical protein ElyMa_005445800 [Elysia marginata]